MSVGIFNHSDCKKHFMGEMHPESPARLNSIEDHLIACGLDFVIKHFEATPIEKALLELAHEKQYIDFIYEQSPDQGSVILDADTQMNESTLNAALLSAGAAINALDKVMSGEITAGFCETRPPGHHAEHDKAMGFCIFNNVAITALYAQKKYCLNKIAILDFDVHHGNGTENIVKDKDGILFCSTFQHPLYPNSGTEPQPPHIINTPISAGTSGSQYREIITTEWLPRLEAFKPELILISAGFDAHRDDSISAINLLEEDYRWITDQIKLVADKYANGKMISILEGGYNIHALARSVEAHIRGLIG